MEIPTTKVGGMDFRWAFKFSIAKLDGMVELASNWLGDFPTLKEIIVKATYDARGCAYCASTIDVAELPNLEDAIDCALCPIGQHAKKVVGVLVNGCHAMPQYKSVNNAQTRQELIDALRSVTDYMRGREEEMSVSAPSPEDSK